MKVLQVHNRYRWPGGEDQVAREECQLLRKKGHEVAVYERTNEEWDGLAPVALMARIRKELHWSEKTYKDLRVMISEHKPDLVHIHNIFFMVTSSVYDACRDEGVPAVQTLHNYRFLCPIGTFYRDSHVCEDCLKKGRHSVVLHRCFQNSFVKSYLLKSVIDRVYKDKYIPYKVDRFIALSRFSRDKFIRNGLPEEKLVIKPNFLSEEPLPKDKAGEYVLYVGALQHYKGIEGLVRLWPEGGVAAPLKIAGAGPLGGRIKALSAGKNIELLGERPAEEIRALIRDSRFVIVPSRCYENFPRIIAEAYASSVPVVANRIGALAELVENDKTGLLIDMDNSAELRSVVQKMMGDESYAMALGKNARKVFENRYSQDVNYAELMKIYKDILSERKDKPPVNMEEGNAGFK